MTEALEDLPGKPTVLVISSAERMVSNTLELLKKLLSTHDSGVYVTVNHPYKVLNRLFEENKIDLKQLFFVDCITQAASGQSERADHCLYLASPSNLTELSIGITQALESLSGEKKFIFIDSLGTFLIYNEAGSLTKFSHFLIARLQLLGVDGIFMCIDKEMDEKLIAELTSFCSKTIKLP